MTIHGDIPLDRKIILEHVDIYLNEDTFDLAVGRSPYSKRAFTELLINIGIFRPDITSGPRKTAQSRTFGYLYSIQNQVDIEHSIQDSANFT